MHKDTNKIITRKVYKVFYRGKVFSFPVTVSSPTLAREKVPVLRKLNAKR